MVQSHIRSPVHRVRDWHPDCLLQGEEGLRNPREVSFTLLADFLPRPVSRLEVASPNDTLHDEDGAGKLSLLVLSCFLFALFVWPGVASRR